MVREIDLYGEQDSFCLEVCFDEPGYITSASFRIDFRYAYEDILRELIDSFWYLKGLVIIDEESGYNTELNYEFIDNIIQTSLQMKIYCNHPY